MGPKTMRRPGRLIQWRNSRGRRVIEPESFVSSSCVGDQFQNLKRNKIEKKASAEPRAGQGQPNTAASVESAQPGNNQTVSADRDA